MSGSIGIIGGSGIYNLSNAEVVREIEIQTPYGNPSDKITEFKLEGKKFFFLPRHGKAHSYLPSEVNYCANIYALKSLGVTHLLSVSAVGSLKEELPPRTFVFPSQFIDWTKGLRRRTFFGDGMVGHVSVAEPIEPHFQRAIYKIATSLNVLSSIGGSYICIEGPQFSSKAESDIYRSFGASVIGMTNVPEAYLAKEAGMAYVTMAMVTDYDCWKDDHCTLEEIMKIMQDNNKEAHRLVREIIVQLSDNLPDFKPENINAVITKENNLTKKHHEIANVLLS